MNMKAEELTERREETDFWDEPDQWSEGVQYIVDNTEFCDLQANEWIAEIAAVWVNLFLLGMFDKETQQTHKLVGARRLIVDGDEMWHLRLRKNE